MEQDGDLREQRSRARVWGSTLAVGVGLGGVLARCRAPLVPDVFDAAGVSPDEAAWTRAAALIFAAVVLVLGRGLARRAPVLLLVGVTVGVSSRLFDPLDGALIVGQGEPMLALLPWALLAVLGAAFARRQHDVVSSHTPARVLVGLAVAAAGVAIQVEGLARIARRLGLGHAADDALFALVFAAFLPIGAFAFGRALGGASTNRIAGAIAVASAVSVAALAIVAAVTTPLGFKALCARFGADASLAGTPLVDAAVALTVFVLPGLAIGALFFFARGRAAFAAILVGAAVGLVSVPLRLRIDPSATLEGLEGLGSSGLVRSGALLAGLGVLLVATMGRGRARAWTAAAGLGLALIGVVLPVSRVPVLDPWERFPAPPRAIFETAAGQFTIEPAGGRSERVTLDQRPLSPRGRDQHAGAERIATTLGALVPVQSNRPQPQPQRRVLLIGLLTPQRAFAFLNSQIDRVDRTAHWWRAMSVIERDLLRGERLPEGEVLAPDVAHARAIAGEYDLVIAVAPGTHGVLTAALLESEATGPRSTANVVWLDASRPAAHLRWSSGTFFEPDGVEGLSLALNATSAQHLWTLDHVPARATAPTLLTWMSIRPDERARRAWRDTTARMADSGNAAPMLQALALHAAAQRMSSPFETWAQKIELDDHALRLWRDHALESGSLPHFEHVLYESLARVIEGKRAVPLAYEILEPILEAHSDSEVRPLALARALASADREELEFAAAAARLELFGLAQELRGMDTLPAEPGAGETLLLADMLAESDGGIVGTIESRSVEEVDAGDGAPIYFTTLRIVGTDLATGEHKSLAVMFAGGFTDETSGSFTASAPAADETRVGRHVLAFHKHTDNIVGGLTGDLLTGARAGLFTAFESRKGSMIVQGRGPGRAIGRNVTLVDLRARVRAILERETPPR